MLGVENSFTVPNSVCLQKCKAKRLYSGEIGRWSWDNALSHLLEQWPSLALRSIGSSAEQIYVSVVSAVKSV